MFPPFNVQPFGNNADAFSFNACTLTPGPRILYHHPLNMAKDSTGAPLSGGRNRSDRKPARCVKFAEARACGEESRHIFTP